MKCNPIKTLTLEFTLDSSEVIMLTKGGKHTLDLKEFILDYNEDDEKEGFLNLHDYSSVQVTFQMARNAQGMFDHTYGEAMRHKANMNGVSP